jgi:hypothetical protein
MMLGFILTGKIQLLIYMGVAVFISRYDSISDLSHAAELVKACPPCVERILGTAT